MTKGQLLKQARENACLSQKELADKVGVSVAYICRIEKDDRINISTPIVKSISDVLKIDPSTFSDTREDEGGIMENRNFGIIIGNNIKSCLEEYQMDIKALARILGVTRPTMYNYVEGNTIIDSYRLHLVARRFHKTLEWFLEEEHVKNDDVFTNEQQEWIRREIRGALKNL